MVELVSIKPSQKKLEKKREQELAPGNEDVGNKKDGGARQ